MDTTRLSAVMDGLRSSVETHLGQAGDRRVCVAVLSPGTEAVADWCRCDGRERCGMAWVRLVRLFPAPGGLQSPTQRPAAGVCTDVLAAELEVGVYRCLPTADEHGRPPSAATQTQATLEQVDDALMLHSAIAPAMTDLDHVLGTYTPRAGGGCGGGAWLLQVRLTAVEAATVRRPVSGQARRRP